MNVKNGESHLLLPPLCTPGRTYDYEQVYGNILYP